MKIFLENISEITRCKCYGAHCLPHRDLRDGRQVVMRVVRHDYAAEQNGHNARQMNTFSKCVRKVREYEHHAKLQGWIPSQFYILEQVCRS